MRLFISKARIINQNPNIHFCPKPIFTICTNAVFFVFFIPDYYVDANVHYYKSLHILVCLFRCAMHEQTCPKTLPCGVHMLMHSVWTPFHSMYENSTLCTNWFVHEANTTGAFIVHQGNAAGACIVHQGNVVEHFGSYIKAERSSPTVWWGWTDGWTRQIQPDWYHHWLCWAGIILCMCPANERQRYIVTSSLIGWAHKQYDPGLSKGIMITFGIYSYYTNPVLPLWPLMN